MINYIAVTALLLASLAVNAPWSFGWLSESWIDLSPLFALVSGMFLLFAWRHDRPLLGRLTLFLSAVLFLKPTFEAFSADGLRSEATAKIILQIVSPELGGNDCISLPPHSFALGGASTRICEEEGVQILRTSNGTVWFATDQPLSGEPVLSLAQDAFDGFIVTLSLAQETLTIAATVLPNDAELNRAALTTRRLALQVRHLNSPTLAVIKDEEGPISKRHRRFIEAARLAPLDQIGEFGRALTNFEPRWQLWGRGVQIGGEWQSGGDILVMTIKERSF